MQGQRGAFLSILVAVTAAGITLASVALVADPDIQRHLGPLPDWFNPYVIALCLARLFALWGIWKLRRWGVYAFFLLEFVELGTGLLVFTSLLSAVRVLVGVPTFLILLGIYFLAQRPRWQLLR